MKPPEYFDVIQKEASEDWESFKQRPHRAGPWHQLFKQVQSPRHVISELLQNADDAYATEASVEIKNGELVFTHNGDDFNADQFQSLCRFGFSNKRALHTIGFRGIGFKSTFSIGDEVRLLTPTLSVAFRRERFTEPIWMDDIKNGERTEIHVSIKDDLVKNELTKNFNEWKSSPASLLFFKSIRCLYIDNQEIRWIPQEIGPVENSQWMELANHPDQRFLHIVSEEEEFPGDCLEEIKIERLAFEQELEFPPCRVEIVAGMEGKLFVVLPTGVKTNLPFACNAPFIQDSARLKIKELSISPTNRWLLERIGRLVSKSMLSWLKCENITLEERTEAYTLGPSISLIDTTLEGACGQLVEEAFVQDLKNETLLLTESGDLELANKCVAVPQILLKIWEEKQVSALFDDKQRIILSSQISGESLKKLIKWGFVQELNKNSVIQVLKNKSLPKPETWRQLMLLWEYLSEEVTTLYYVNYQYINHKDVRIVPVQGQDILFAYNQVKRLGEKQLLDSDDDWQFLSQQLLVLNPNWTRFLGEQRLEAETRKDIDLGKQVESAYKVLSALNLGAASDTSSIIQQFSDRFFTQNKLFTPDYIRLSQIAATLGSQVSENFKYATFSHHIHSAKENVLADLSDDLSMFIEPKYYLEHVLHPDYFKHSQTCSDADWRQWVRSEKSRLLTFAPLIKTGKYIYGKTKIKTLLRERGFDGEPDYPYKGEKFFIFDWDFESSLWEYWQSLAKDDTKFWFRLFNRILMQPQNYWMKALSATAGQEASNGSERPVTTDPLIPAWIMKFRSVACLPDDLGQIHQPAELLRRTPQTEVFRDVEQFVAAEIDIEANRPLLQMLGVRDTPTGPEKVLERLNALAKAPSPPLHEVLKWCQRLDQITYRCSTDELQLIADYFKRNKTILSESCSVIVWANSDEVSLAANEMDVPDALIIHSLVRHLALWQKIGVAPRPSADQVINWLKTLSSGNTLKSDDARRVRTLLPSYPERIWNECQHWLDIDGKWEPVENFEYALTMQSLVGYKELFDSVKQKTADFQRLNEEQCSRHPFSLLPRLKNILEEHFKDSLYGLPHSQSKPWIVALGNGLSRLSTNGDEETLRIRQLGQRLAQTLWQETQVLETIPYISGKPVGTARSIPVLWKDNILYVARQSSAKIAKVVPESLGSVFQNGEISDAIKLCFDRTSEWVNDYLEQNFKLASFNEIKREEKLGDHSTQQDSAIEKPEESLHPSSGEIIKPVVGDAEEAQEENGPEVPSDIDTGKANGESSDDNPPKPKPLRPDKPVKPALIELYTASRGFSPNGGHRYVEPNGGWIEKARDNTYEWEEYSPAGELIQYYYLKEHCLELEPLHLDAVIWDLCEKFPALYSLVLVDSLGKPVRISGSRLKNMKDKGSLELYPAAYRLVYKDER